MSGRYTTKFFERASTQSQVKHKVLEAYLVPWSTKLGSRHSRIWYVDGFAGPGQYNDGSSGSPKFALEQSLRLSTRGQAKLQCLFMDKSREHARSLLGLAARYPAASSQIIHGDFWERAGQIPLITRDEPVLLFVDPFGVAGIRFDVLATLCNALKRVDIIINFRSPVVSRLAPELAERVTQAVGSDDWTPESASKVFRQNLREHCGFETPASLTVASRFGGKIQTELILASRHPDAYELWNDQIVLAVERLMESSGVLPEDRDRDISIIESRLLGWARDRVSWTRQDGVSWHCVTYCGEAHSGVIKRANDNLLRRKVWIRDRVEPSIDQDSMRWGQGQLFP